MREPFFLTGIGLGRTREDRQVDVPFSYLGDLPGGTRRGVFLNDCSGSMAGTPFIEAATRAI